MPIDPMLVFAVAAPFVLGMLVVRGCGLRFEDDRLGFVAWALPAGCLLLGLLLTAYLVFGVEPWLWWSAPGFALLVAGLLAVRGRGAPSPFAVRVPRPRIHAGFLAVVVVLLAWCLLHAFAGAARPLVEGDEGNIWSLKAKSLYLDWYLGDFAAAQRWNLHPDYPLLNPLLQAWIHALQGRVEHFAARVLVQGCAVSLLLAVAAAVRARLSALHAGLLLLLLPFAPTFLQMLTTAYADGMVALGLVMALDGYLRWLRDRRTAWLWLAAVGAAFACWSKNEALLYVAAAGLGAVVQFAVCRGRPQAGWWRALPCLAVPVAVVALQMLWNRHFGLQSDLFGANPTGKSLPELVLAQFAERAPAMLARAGGVMVFSAAPHAVLGAVLASAALFPRHALGPRLLAAYVALAASCLGLHLVWIGSFLPLQFHLDTSYVRVTFQLVPAAMVFAAALAQSVLAGSDATARADARTAA